MAKIKNPMIAVGQKPILSTKTITSNGTFNASDDGVDGWDTVVVSVPSQSSKFASLVDRSITAVTADDLAGVTEIGNAAFEDCTRLTSVVIPSNVVSASYYAFRGCRALSSVTIQEGFQRIGQDAFYNCSSLTNIILPNSLTRIGYRSFNDTRLSSIVIPINVARIGGSAFGANPNLTTVTILTDAPPTLDNVNAFPTSNTGFKIYVKASALSAYQTATNWVSLYANGYIEAIPSP